MKKYMPLEGLRWSRDSGSALCDTSQNSRSRTGWGGNFIINIFFIPLQFFSYQDDNIAVQDDNIAVTIDTFE